MKQVYAVAEILVNNPDGYVNYLPLSTASVEKFGGTFLVRAGRRIQQEGGDEQHNPTWRTVIVSFNSLDCAQRWYDSDDYKAAREIRMANSHGRLFFIEGL